MNQEFFGDSPLDEQQDAADQAQNQNQSFGSERIPYQAPDQQLNYDSNSDVMANMNQEYEFQAPVQVDDQTTRKMREDEQRIQEQLRQKSNDEYEEKQARKEKGRKSLEQLLDKKQEQKAERKRENIAKQEQRKQESKGANDVTGWKKVAANVALKQGEHPGRKEVNRMRQSIVNKKNDEA